MPIKMFYVLVKLYLQNPTLFLLVKPVRNFVKSRKTHEQNVTQNYENYFWQDLAVYVPARQNIRIKNVLSILVFLIQPTPTL